jgi:hypothetical protein
LKPLDTKKLQEFHKRFDDFIGAEIASIEIISPTSIKLTLMLQDSLRGYDWISLELLFDDVVDAKLIEEEKLKLLNNSSGFSFIKENTLFGFGCDKYHDIIGIKNALCYIISKNIKYKEGIANI